MSNGFILERDNMFARTTYLHSTSHRFEEAETSTITHNRNSLQTPSRG